MMKNVWCAPLLLVAFGCAHSSQAGGEQKAEGHAPVACTQIGCMDALFVELKSPHSVWAPGSYSLELTAGDHSYTCSFALPRDLPQPGHVGEVQCTPVDSAPPEPVHVMLNQESVCSEQVTADSVSSTCEPVPERYAMQLHIPGTPKVFALQLKRDDEQLIARTYEPEYKESRPNGPRCEPLCRQARIEEKL